MRPPKRGKITRIAVIAVLVVLLALGGPLGYWGFREMKDDSSDICAALKERAIPQAIVAQGSFLTHNKDSAYIGDIIGFELAVVYDERDAHVSVGDRALQNFDVAPFILLDKSKVVSETHASCSAKRITFVFQAIDVVLAGENEFRKTDNNGLTKRPEIIYAQNGITHTASISYTPLYVAPLTNGTPYPVVQSPLQKIAVPQKSDDNLLHIRLAFAAAFLASGLLLTLAALSPRKKKALSEISPDSLPILFPEIFSADVPQVRLRRLYFNLLLLADEGAYISVRTLLGQLAKRASVVLRPEGDQDAPRALEQIYGVLKYNKAAFDAIYLRVTKERGEA